MNILSKESWSEGIKAARKLIGFLTIPIIIAIITLGVAIWTLIVTKEGAKSSQENLAFIRQEQQQKLDPLIHYKYLSDSKEFEVLSHNDVEIKKISWVLVPQFIQVNEFSNNLILDELKYSLLSHLDTNRSREVVKSFIDCYLFGSEFYKGIPLVTEVEFRRRGSAETFKQIDLIRLKGSERDGLYVYVEKPGVGIVDVENYKFDTQEDYDIYKKSLGDYSISGECGVQFGYPPKELW